MLSLAECRVALDGECSLSDEELEALRDQHYALAEMLIDYITAPDVTEVDRSRHSGPDSETAPRRLQEAQAHSPELDWGAVEERAAIREFDGHQSRDEAERGAVSDLLLSRVN